MLLAEDAVVVEGELLARAELPLAGVAGEAGEVVDAVAGAPHPVRGADAAAALGAPRAEVPAGGGRDGEKGGQAAPSVIRGGGREGEGTARGRGKREEGERERETQERNDYVRRGRR